MPNSSYSEAELEALAEIAFVWLFPGSTDTFQASLNFVISNPPLDFDSWPTLSTIVNPEAQVIHFDSQIMMELATSLRHSRSAVAKQNSYMRLYADCLEPTDHMGTCQPLDNLLSEPLNTTTLLGKR